MSTAASTTPRFVPEADRLKLQKTFDKAPVETHTRRWDELYQQNFTPWDRKGPSLALRDVVTGNPGIFGSPVQNPGNKQRKRALVPGCGRGYDVLLLASLGYDAYGLDASSTAHEEAKRVQKEFANGEQYAPSDPEIGKGDAIFVLDDFFKNDFLAKTEGGHFDVIFDYTFLCALPHELRAPWAKRQSELLSPNGHLVCLEWPLGKDPKDGGPPYSVSGDLYEQLLQRPGEEVMYDNAGLVIEGSNTEKNGNALIRVFREKPERTHTAGKDTDYISIWAHVAN